eukprot:1157930-Pelagomonas_calceolata.AAC.10
MRRLITYMRERLGGARQCQKQSAQASIPSFRPACFCLSNWLDSPLSCKAHLTDKTMSQAYVVLEEPIAFLTSLQSNVAVDAKTLK